MQNEGSFLKLVGSIANDLSKITAAVNSAANGAHNNAEISAKQVDATRQSAEKMHSELTAAIDRHSRSSTWVGIGLIFMGLMQVVVAYLIYTKSP